MSKWIVTLFFLTLIFTAATSFTAARQVEHTIAVEPIPGASPAQARAIIQDILDAINVKASFEVRAAKIPNAAAAMAKGKRYILYNPAFIAAIYKATGSNRWAPISILAHEIGHHLKGHTMQRTGSHPAIELEADEFSGFVLRRMGATLEDAQLAMRIASSRRASATHPARHDRLESIANGWVKADGQLAGTGRTRRTARIPEPEPTLADKYIAYDVHFKADPNSSYHVTVRNNLIKLAGNKVSVFGKLVATNSESYPYALKAGDDVLLVSNRGSIFTTEGRNLGYVTPRRR